MKKFNFDFVKKLVSFLTYAGLMAVLVFDSFTYIENRTESFNQHFMSWWALFLVLDLWYFGGRPGHEKREND